jgi:hypothetical protein
MEGRELDSWEVAKMVAAEGSNCPECHRFNRYESNNPNHNPGCSMRETCIRWPGLGETLQDLLNHLCSGKSRSTLQGPTGVRYASPEGLLQEILSLPLGCILSPAEAYTFRKEHPKNGKELWGTGHLIPGTEIAVPWADDREEAGASCLPDALPEDF